MEKKSTKALTVINIVIIALCLLSTLLMLFPVVFNAISKEDKPVFGHYLYLNTNNNLVPVMKLNDLIAVKPMPLEQMAVGDFLCYYPVGEEEAVQFGKIVGIDGAVLALSDKTGHSTEVAVSDIVVVGRAASTILFLGSVVHFFQDNTNRMIFSVTVGGVAVALLLLTILLHITVGKKKHSLPAEENESISYSLEELLEIENELIEFEKAPKKEEIML